MNLNNSTLDDWLISPSSDFLKRGGDDFEYHSKYDVFRSYLGNGLHNEVTKQAIYNEIKNEQDFDKVIWLNDHGPKHIKAVIERASQLLDTGKDDIQNFIYSLNAREVFLLLNAIQVHDIGNFYGRHNHENRVLDAIKNGLTPILFDITEVKYINDIARVHGGKVKYKDGSKDKNTIRTIRKEIMSNSYPIRLQMLAAILRFADELAEEKQRADINSLENGSLPKGSEVFHAFSACIDSINVNHPKSTVEVHLKIPKKYVTRTFGKLVFEEGKKRIINVFLLDEIYKRILKMHYERIYCSKFWKGMIEIENIWVQIEFYKDFDALSETLDFNELNVHKDITFNLHDNYYPIEGDKNIFDHCPELIYENSSKITGESLKLRIEKDE
ncbi:hypothetical protein [uncultured Marixanthomonas sp.]|uniref:HD domain-containing protein n=1 Tax=uncultured Marixanthomonas sp. TaxID=757245 RepID=UPI0030DB52E3|tara:strand:- start:245095 stop:246249 length:1155 start_codon:yes stop_codon:yes gene_type:complete